MSAWRITALFVGFAFFGIVASANGIMALGLGPTHPLMVLWALVPMPLVFLALRFRTPRTKAICVLGYSYLGRRNRRVDSNVVIRSCCPS